MSLNIKSLNLEETTWKLTTKLQLNEIRNI